MAAMRMEASMSGWVVAGILSGIIVALVVAYVAFMLQATFRG